MRRFDAVLFDVDGTLLHSSPGIFEGLRYTAARLGVPVEGQDLTPYLGPPLRVIFERLLPDPSMAPRAVEIYREHYVRVGSRMCKPYPFVPSMLAALRRQGVLLATATCKLQPLAAEMLGREALVSFFSCIGGASPDGRVESKFQVIRSVLARPEFGRAAEAGRLLMVGDRRDDVAGAKACGLPVAGAVYGYGGRAELKKAGADFLVEDGDELLDLVCPEKGAHAPL